VSTLDIKHGEWQRVLADHDERTDGLRGIKCNALIFDAPYSAKTHDSETTRKDGSPTEGLAPKYRAMTEQQIEVFVAAWAHVDGWMVSITDDVLAPLWRSMMADHGRCTFAAVPCVMKGMTCRIQGDGPSSWAVYAMVSRPRTKAFSTWGTLPGAYVGPPSTEAGGGRGKPDWLMRAIVGDYSRPGDLVCDPFAGWGSTLTAAIGLGRRAIGSDVDAEAIAEAQRRAARGVQADLFT
jgi:DNA methylase